MTADKTLFNFFNGFGMPAYPDTAVPSDTIMPYMTYTVPFGAFGDLPLPITVKLWYHTESEAIPTEKALEIMRLIDNGINLPCDGGCIFLTMGQPRGSCFTAEDDKLIKGRMLNVSATYNIIM